MQGLKLDAVYALFSRRQPWSPPDQLCCETCPDRDPHPVGWTWAEEFAVEQEAVFAKLYGKGKTA